MFKIFMKPETNLRSSVEAIRLAREESRRAENIRIEEERRKLRDASERRKRDEEEAVSRQLSAIKGIGDRAKALSEVRVFLIWGLHYTAKPVP